MILLIFAVAVLLCTIAAPLALVWTFIDAIRYPNMKRRLAVNLYAGAVALDIFGNVAYPSMLNAWFCKRGAHLHGQRDETISSVLGKNWTTGHLTLAGQMLAGFLNMVDRNHCYLAIIGDWPHGMPDPIDPWKGWAFAAFVALATGAGIWILF